MSRKIIRDFEDELSELRFKRSLLDNEIQTIERMIRKAKGEPDPQQVDTGGKRRQNVKGIVIGLLQERPDLGITPGIAVDMAQSRGITLEKTTVSSLLSRLKNDGVVNHDGSVYRLVSRAAKTQPADAVADLLH
ncbi:MULTISPECIES: hypothetical protein [Methylobacterium]|uniref:hypothetical protein n=1 Tax=Methylobacterium TaxID=407 RepID=UPI00272DDD61|nr:hypothetical protein [Methylobacterium sp.]